MTNPSTALGKYRLLSRVGAGAMGEVWRAEDSGHVRRTVAIKLIATAGSDGPAMTRVLLNEAQAMASLPQHPNLVTLYDVLELDGLVGLVMEFVEGTGLRERMERSPQGLPWGDLYPIAQGLMEGLIHAHGHGLIHRDLKPENMKLRTLDLVGSLVAEDLKILDFGLARHDPGHLSTKGEVSGTPSYMSPEQIAGLSQGPLCDQYALGVILFELMTGRLPVEPDGHGLVAWYEAHSRQPVRSLCALRQDVPFSVEAVVRKALAKAPEDRHASVSAMAGALLPELAYLAQWNRNAWETDGADVTVPVLEALGEQGPLTFARPPKGPALAPAPFTPSRESMETYSMDLGDAAPTLFERQSPLRVSRMPRAAGLRHRLGSRLIREAAAREVALARQIQAEWLPSALPSAPGWEAHGSGGSQGARETWGGWVLPNGCLRYTLAEAAGAGVGPVLLMAAFLAWMDAHAGSDLEPSALTGLISRGLGARARHPLSSALVDLDPGSGRLRITNAGHLSPLIIREDGSLEAVPSHGQPLAQLGGDDHGQYETVLQPGDLLALVTHGHRSVAPGAGQGGDGDQLLTFLASQRRLALPVLDQALRAEGRLRPEQGAVRTVVLVRRERSGPCARTPESHPR